MKFPIKTRISSRRKFSQRGRCSRLGIYYVTQMAHSILCSWLYSYLY